MITRYRIKSSPEREEFLEVLRRNETGCQVRIVRCYEGYETVTESFLERHLFEMCLQTGYLTEDVGSDRRQAAEAVAEHNGHAGAVAGAFSVA